MLMENKSDHSQMEVLPKTVIEKTLYAFDYLNHLPVKIGLSLISWKHFIHNVNFT